VRGRYGLLVASDVLYEREAGVLLAGFIGRHALPQAEVWVVDPDRGNRGPLQRGLAALGFTAVAAERLGVPGGSYKGRLLRFTRA
jgi:hypothetical protein